MIDAQEAKYLQKIDDGLVKTFEIIEETIRDAARNGQPRVEISFAFSDLPEERYADVAAKRYCLEHNIPVELITKIEV